MREAPNWLYERLPYLYVLGGAVAATGFELSADAAAGLALVLAGLGILRLRIHYRLKSIPQIRFRLGALR
jgi:hypothetical protein